MKFSEIVDNLPAVAKRPFLIQQGGSKGRLGVQQMELSRCSVRYRIAGKGSRTIVFATDPPVVIEQYEELIKHLESSFKVVVIELPGFGFSHAKLNLSFEFEAYALSILEFLQKLNMGPYTLAFPCIAGYAAIWIANTHPQWVSRVVLMQTPSWEDAKLWQQRRDPHNLLRKPVVGQVLLHLLKRNRAAEWLKAAVGNQDKLEEFLKNTDQAFKQGASFSLASAFQYYLNEKPSHLGPLQQPALVVWGQQDRSYKKTAIDSSMSLCQNPTCCGLSDAGHFPELEAPDLFSHKLEDFVLGRETNVLLCE